MKISVQRNRCELKLRITTDPKKEYGKENYKKKQNWMYTRRKLTRRADFIADVWQLIKQFDHGAAEFMNFFSTSVLDRA